MPGAVSPGISLSGRIGDRPLLQIAVFVAIVAAIGLVETNLTANMGRAGLRPGFGFLAHPANFAIGESLIPYGPQDSFGRAIVVGLLNTLLVSALGCVLATVVGVAVGLARISTNRLLAGIARGYVEIVRNTPLLLQLFFWSATFEALPGPRQALAPLPGVLLSNRGVFFPALHMGLDQWIVAAIVIAVGIVSAVAVRHSPLGGKASGATIAFGLAVLATLLVVVGVPSGNLNVELPRQHGFNIEGGLAISPEFAALLVGLLINASAGIAEIIRGGIAAIPAGQWDAARALGLSTPLALRHVVLPQVARIVVPVMTSSYLSLTKNSSLAVAIGYPDLVSILNTEANQSGQALETIIIMAAVYLTISLAVSVAMNAWNARITVGQSRP
jgi:general L-amino acid transport system permease protein